MPDPRLITFSDHIDWAQAELEQSDAFFGHGCDNARDEAIWAALHVIGEMDCDLEDVVDEPLTREQSLKFQELIERRIETRKPLAYLINEAWFAAMPFYIDERAIIPRSHIGDLVRDGFGPWVRFENLERVLDLCTGSGCIAVALAFRFPDVMFDAADIDRQALEVAKINIARFGVDSQVTTIESNLFDALAGRRYDLIVCNPPYVSATEIDSLPAEYQHEPRLALEADDDGLGIVRSILCNAASHLTERGHLMMELGDSAQLLEARFPRVPFLWLTSRSGESVVLLISAKELKVHAAEFGCN